MMMLLAVRRHAIESHRVANPRHGEAGQVTVMMLIMAPILIFGFVGLLWDGGQAVNHRAEVEDVAFGAARVAANQTQSGPTGPSMDPAAAVTAANAYINQFDAITGTVSVSGNTVTVITQGTYDPDFMAVIGVGAWTFTATHTAETQVGVTAKDN